MVSISRESHNPRWAKSKLFVIHIGYYISQDNISLISRFSQYLAKWHFTFLAHSLFEILDTCCFIFQKFICKMQSISLVFGEHPLFFCVLYLKCESVPNKM